MCQWLSLYKCTDQTMYSLKFVFNINLSTTLSKTYYFISSYKLHKLVNLNTKIIIFYNKLSKIYPTINLHLQILNEKHKQYNIYIVRNVL